MTRFDPISEFQRLKSVPFGRGIIAGVDWGVPGLDLVCFGSDRVAEDDETVAMIARWREENNQGFPRQGAITVAGTKAWAKAQLVERPDRILFLIRQDDGRFIGHIGLSSLDPAQQSGEYDNIVRGDKDARRGIMVDASHVLLRWAYHHLGYRRLWLKVFWDNFRAVALYHRLGFEPTRLHPLRRIDGVGVVEWVDTPEDGVFDRFHVTMVHRPDSV